MNTLLICPKFFGYQDDISQALISKNHKVTYIDEKPYNNNFFKILVRLFGKSTFVRRIIRKHILTSLEKINGTLDYVIVVKGESLSLENVIFLKEKYPKATFLFYAWDSIKNYPHVLEYLPLFNRCYTFDNNDIQQFPFLKHLPLFYSKEYGIKHSINPQTIKPRIVFAGTVHSDRYELLGKIYKKYHHVYDFNFFLYFPSKILFLKFLKNNIINIMKYKILGFSLCSKTKSQVADYFLNATAIIDIQHPMQHGLTMRTIEVLPLNRKLITTNREIKNYDFYRHENVLIIDRDEPILTEEFLFTSFQEIDPDIIHRYSVDGWVTKILAKN